MNFLAHLYLSGNSHKIMIGNFIGDYVKGKDYENFADGIKYGILLHRKIDSFTDSHPIVKQSKNHFNKKYGKYAGVITDIIYDHFLSMQWCKYSNTPFEDFIYNTYEILLDNFDLLPTKVQKFVPDFVVYEWLNSYKTIEGLRKVFDRMSIKTSLPKESN